MNVRPSVLRHALSTPSSTRLPPRPRRLEKTRASAGALRRLHDEPKAQKHLDWPLHEWRSAQHSPAKNATWEDWEQWRDERDGKKQAPVYMSHGAFAVLLTFAISIGIIGQANRAGKMASSRMDLLQEKQGKLGAVMDKRSSKTAAMGRKREWNRL
ncbi:unnamed protein product [Parascedosporium putredinis]|uniref:Uncharacterized protein n=1 Tax=Parascedosporium putredinis TaxID=1442378 RepID=A0A9P1H578_9PEZI|nr:unnamed protein product [Parascedosporium putredinis]CAI7996198.1 unnamed protein product [Parascedosporium putredinis]